MKSIVKIILRDLVRIIFHKSRKLFYVVFKKFYFYVNLYFEDIISQGDSSVMIYKRSFLFIFFTVFSSLIFADAGVMISKDNLNTPQEIVSRYGAGSFFITIKDIKLNKLENTSSPKPYLNRFEVIINYEIRHSFQQPVSQYEIEFDLFSDNAGKFSDFKQYGYKPLGIGEVKTETLKREIFTKYSNISQIDAIKVEVEKAYLQNSKQKIKF